MQEVFRKIEEIKNKVIALLKINEKLIDENKILAKKIQSLEQELEFLREKLNNKTETVEKEKIREELMTYINEIDELIKIM